MSDIARLTKIINTWVRERNMERFQKPKDLAISLCLESAEVLEHFQWKGEREIRKYLATNKQEVADEIADVGVYLLKLADKLGIDLGLAIEAKMEKAAKKYPAKVVASDKNLESYYRIKKEVRKARKK